MAYINKRDRFNAIVKVKIAFGTKLGCETDSEAEITLREPTQMEVLEWREANAISTTDGMKKFKSMLVDMMVNHNLMEDENEKMTNEAVAELIYSKTEIVQLVVEEWSNKVFHIPQNSNGGK